MRRRRAVRQRARLTCCIGCCSSSRFGSRAGSTSGWSSVRTGSNSCSICCRTVCLRCWWNSARTGWRACARRCSSAWPIAWPASAGCPACSASGCWACGGSSSAPWPPLSRSPALTLTWVRRFSSECPGRPIRQGCYAMAVAYTVQSTCLGRHNNTAHALRMCQLRCGRIRAAAWCHRNNELTAASTSCWST